MRGIARLLFVAGLAVIAFVIALFSFSANELPASACVAEAAADPSYAVTLQPDPSVDITTYTLDVRRAGQPVAGAQVCLRADMGGAGKKSGVATSALAREVAPGEYEISIRFDTAGPWRVHVQATERDREPVDVPTQIDVR